MSADSSFMVFFLDEASDILGGWEKACLDYEQTGSKEAAESLYRGAHNLKSGSAAVGLSEFSTFIHHVEDLISRLLSDKIQSSPQLIRLFLDVHTILTTWINNLRIDPKYVPKEPQDKIDQEIQLLHGDSAGESPTAAAVDPAMAAAIEAMTGSGHSEPTATSTVEQESSPPAAAVSVPTQPSPATEQSKPQQPAATHANRPSESVRVAANKLDMLIQLVGELSTQQAIVWHGRQNGLLNSQSCDTAIQLVQKNSKDLQSLALSLRMQPLQSLFQRLERASRDLARGQGKKIEVVPEGDHVELDRAVIERITEALMHVIRNAVDHGIEDPQTREATGKLPAATLRLTGAQEPGGILITISDDGRGLNLKRILEKAIEKGLAQPDQKYSDAEIQRFIFLHGFSTAEKVTDVSGRGVGMDVVKNAVQAIGGSISVASTSGKGTVFSIALPTTLSIVDALIIEVDSNRYAVPVQDVMEIVDLGSFKIETTSSSARLFSLRQLVIPIENLADHLPSNTHKLPQNHGSKSLRSESIKPALLVRADQEILAFQVDHIGGQHPVSMRPLPGDLEAVPGYTGGSILGDGDPCIILNLPSLVRRRVEKITNSEEKSNQVQAADYADHLSMGRTRTENPAKSRHLIFHLRDRLLATPLLSIREILSGMPFNSIVGAQSHVVGCIDVRGEILHVFDLGQALKLERYKTPGPMVVVESDGLTFAVMVDKVEALADLVVSSMPKIPSSQGDDQSEDIDGVSGVANFRDQVISIVDLRQLLSMSQGINFQVSRNRSTAVNVSREAV